MKNLRAAPKKISAACLALLLAAPAGAVGPALTQIGVAGAVRGKVMAFPPLAAPAKTVVGREVASGKPLFLDEKVTTDAKGHMQIMLKDETTFTLGPNASMVLDEFVYDPASGAGEVTASVTKGAFRFVTGKIGAKDPSKMKVKFPTGTMGIRGTIVAGVVNDDGSTTAVLLGPGANNNAGERPGAFNLSNDAGSSDVTQPGFGSNLGAGDAPPTPPALVPSEQLGAIMGALEAPAEQSGSGEGGGSGGSTASTGSSGESSGESSDGSGGTAAGEGGDTASGGDSTGGDTAAGGEAVDGGADMLSSGMDAGDGGTTDVADLAGQDTMGAAGDIADFDSIAGVTDVSNSVTNTASTDSGDSAVVEANSVFIADGASTWDDARTVTGGTGYYGGAGVFTLTQCQGGSCAHPAGFFAYLMKIDFGNQTYSAGSYVWAEDDGTQTAVTDYAMVRETSYAALSGEAVGQAVSDSGELLVNFTLKNIDGVAAAGVDAAASFSNAGGDLGSGTGSFPLVGSMADSAWESVQAVPSGVGVFAGAGYFQLTQCVGSVACVNPDGVFAYLLRIDFGAQTYGGGESGAALMAEDIDTGTSISASMSIPETDFSLLSGSPLIQADGGSFDVDFTLKDVDGNTAAALEAVASYNDGETMGNGTSWGIRAPSDGLTSLWSGLNGVTSGAGYFKGEGVLTLSDCDGGGCVSPTGSFSYLVYIDFASQQFGGNGSVASMAASDPGTGVYVTESMEIGQEPYALYLGPANLVSYGNWHYVSENWAFGMDFSLKDVQGVPGGGLSAYAYYSDDYGNSGEGWTFAPRQAVSDWAGVSAIGSGTAWFAGSGALRPDACYGDYCADLCYGGSCTGPAGGFRYALLVDFAGTYGGSGSGASIWFEDEQYWTSVNDRVDIPAGQPFPENGAAHITSGLSDSGNFSVNFTLTDLSGSSAMGLEASVSYYDGNNWNIGYGHASAGRSSPLADGASTWQDALALEGGMARFGGAGPFVLTQCGGGACLSPEGFFAYVALIDFGARTYQGSAYLKAGSITDDLRVDRTSFDGSSGAASFAGTSDSDSFSVDFSLNNAGGLAAVGLDAVATYDDSLTNPGSPTLGSGSASGPMMGLDSSIWDGVIAIPDGVGVFTGRGAFDLTTCNNSACADPRGFFEYLVKVDFANDTFGGMGSAATILASDPDNSISVSETIEIDNRGFGGFAGNGGANMFDTYYSDDGNAWINFTLKDAAGFSAMGLDALAYYNDGSTFGRGWSYASRLDASDYADVNALQPAGGAGYFRGWGDFFLTSCNGGACANPSGRFDYAVYIDFGLQEFGGKGSSGSVYAAAEAVNLGGAPVSASDALSIGAQPYALFSEINYFTAASPSTYLAMNFTLRDVAGAAAMGLDASAFYNNGSGLIGSGMSYAPRRDVSMWDGANGIQSIGNVTGWYSGSAPLAFSKCNGTACVSPSGSFSYALLVDFANQVIGGGNSGASVSGQYESDGAVYFSDGLFIPKADYSALSGPAHISAKSYSQFLETDFSLVDEAGVTGGSLLALAYYGDSNNTEAFAFDSALQASLPVFAGASTWADIAGLSLGTGHYGGSAPFSLTTCYGFPCGPQTGFFTYLLNIDFAKKTYSGAAYLLARELSEVGANIRGKVYFPETSYGVPGDPASIVVNSGDGYGETAGSSSGVFEVTYSLQNVGSLAGSGIDAVATYTDLDDDILGLGSASGPRAWLEPSFWDSVNLIDSGAGMFSGRGSFVLTKCWGVPCVGGSGAFEYLLQVDFGAGTFGGNGSMVSLWAKYPGDGVGPVDIAAGMEVLNENLNIPAGQLALLSQTNGSLTVDFTLADVGGSAAGGLDVAVRYDDVGNGHFGEGYSYGLWTQLADFDALQTEPGTGLFQGGGELRLQACPGGPCVTPVGAFNYAVLVDFTNRKFGGLGSMAWISGGDVFQNQYFNDSMAIPETPYTDLTTVAVSGPKSSQSSRFRMEFSLKNVTGLASDMDAAAFYADGAGFVGQGISDSERQVIPDWSALAGNITSGDGWLAGSTPFYLTQCGGLACSNPTGSFNYQLYLDFATGKVGGNGSSAYVVAADDVVSIWDSVTIGGGVFKDLAAFYPAGQARVSAASDSGNLIADFTLTNVDSVGALAAEVGAVFNDGSTQGYGRATDGVTGAPFITPSSWVDVTAAAGGGTGQYASGPRPFTLAQCNAGPCGAGPHGTFDFTLSVDFVAQAYNLDANLNIADSNLDNVQYPGQVISQSLNVADDFGTPVAPQIVGSSGSGFGIEVTVNNAGLSPAALADGHATFDDTPFVGGAALPSLGSGMADNVPLVIPPF